MLRNTSVRTCAIVTCLVTMTKLVIKLYYSAGTYGQMIQLLAYSKNTKLNAEFDKTARQEAKKSANGRISFKRKL